MLSTVYTLLVRGTTQQQHAFADHLADAQHQLPASEADLDIFLGALTDWLKEGKPATTPVLAVPFVELWQELEAAVARQYEEN